jgi:hypothetical protein
VNVAGSRIIGTVSNVSAFLMIGDSELIRFKLQKEFAGFLDKTGFPYICSTMRSGADVTVAATYSGVAGAFITDSGGAVDRRTRVRNMAEMYEMHRGHVGMPEIRNWK